MNTFFSNGTVLCLGFQAPFWNINISTSHFIVLVTLLVLLGLHTFGSPGPHWAVVINHVVESEGHDEEGAVTGCVHLEGYIPLVQTHCLTLFSL